MGLFTEKKVEMKPKTQLPDNKDKILLVDADTVAYSVAVMIEELVEEYEDDMGNLQQEYHLDLDLATEISVQKIQDMLESTGCKAAELHFTGGRSESFRRLIYPPYKEDRDGTRTPERLMDLKKKLCEEFPNSQIHTKWEADDYVVWAMKEYSYKYVLAAVDKDVLNSVPGKHWNYYANSKYKIQPKWVEVDEITSLKWPYIQTLTGDSTDNIPGLHRVGPKTAEKLLKGQEFHWEMWKIVVEEYEKRGKTVDDALLTMRLVNMHQLEMVDNKLQINLFNISND